MRARADLARGRRPEVLLRAGELHARPAAGRRRGAGAAGTTSSPRAQLDRHPHRRRPRPRARALDRQRPARRRRHRLQHRPPAPLPGEPRVPAHAHRRVARHGLPVPLPDAVDADRARREASRRSTIGSRRAARTSGRQRLGGRRLVRAARASSRRSSGCRGAGQNWFPYWEAEHRGRARGRDPHGHVVHVEVPRRRGATPGGCSTSISANDVDGDAGRHHLHAVAQRGAARSRPTSPSPSSTTSASGSSPPTPRTATSRPGCGGTSRRRARVRHRRHVRLRAAQRAGPALARAAAAAHDRRPVERGVPVPRRARDRHRLRARAVRPHHLPRRARLRALHPGRAGRCTSTTGSSRRASASACATRASRRWRSLRMEKGYRDYGHDIDNTDSVLEAGLGFAVDLDKPGGFLGRDAVARAEGGGPAHAAGSCRCSSRIPSRCCSTPRSCGATASPSATSARRRTATRSAARSASRWSRPASRSTQAYLDAGTLGGRDRRHALPRGRVASSRSTTRR